MLFSSVLDLFFLLGRGERKYVLSGRLELDLGVGRLDVESVDMANNRAERRARLVLREAMFTCK